MMDAPDNIDGAAEQGDSSSYRRPPPRKEYDVGEPKPKAFMVEDAQWERIQGRVAALEARGGVDWLIAGATMVVGIAASAGLALLALPGATKGGSEFAPFVRPTLWAVAIGGTVVGGALALLWFHFKGDEAKTATDICNEMDTIQAAWQERGPEPSEGTA